MTPRSKIKLAIEKQKRRTFKIHGLPGEVTRQAWDGITVRMQFHILSNIWPHIRYEQPTTHATST